MRPVVRSVARSVVIEQEGKDVVHAHEPVVGQILAALDGCAIKAGQNDEQVVDAAGAVGVQVGRTSGGRAEVGLCGVEGVFRHLQSDASSRKVVARRVDASPNP